MLLGWLISISNSAETECFEKMVKFEDFHKLAKGSTGVKLLTNDTKFNCLDTSSKGNLCCSTG